MKKFPFLLLIIINLLCLIGVAYFYLSDNNNNIIYLSILAVISIVIYKGNKKLFTNKKRDLMQKNMANYKPSIKLKKRYLFWFSCLIFLLYTTVGAIISSNIDSENQKSVNQYLENTIWYESIGNVGILSPIVEEVIFRGLLLILISSLGLWIANTFKRNLSSNISRYTSIIFVVISTILFGVFHVIGGGDYNNILPYLLSGLVFSVVYVYTNTLYASTFVHIIGNTIAIMVYYDEDIAVLVFSAVFIYILVSMLLWLKKHADAMSEETNEMGKELGVDVKSNLKVIKSAFIESMRYLKKDMFTKENVQK